MTKPDPCDSDPDAANSAKIVTTPGDRRAKICRGSNAFPGNGAAFEDALAGSAAGFVGVPAFTSTVRVFPSNQPAPFPMPKAAPPPRTAATRVTAATGPNRIRLTVAVAPFQAR